MALITAMFVGIVVTSLLCIVNIYRLSRADIKWGDPIFVLTFISAALTFVLFARLAIPIG